MLSAFGPFSDFRVTSGEVLKYLHSRFGFKLWMVTRTVGDDWIVLQAEDSGYGVTEGDVFRWTDSFCSRMVQGLGPCVAPKSDAIPSYAAAPIGQQVAIAAYIGLPLIGPDKKLFGTLCAIDPLPQPEGLTQELPQLEIISRMLGTVLANELKAEAETRRAERAERAAETDSLTGLLNRRGWDRLLEAEESRCSRFGNPASVLCIDLDGFKEINDALGHSEGDRMLAATAKALNSAVRRDDVVARFGGDEFGVLAVNSNHECANAIAERIEESLTKLSLRASIGVAPRNPSESLQHAWRLADETMYECKRARGSTRSTVSALATSGHEIG